MITRADRDVFTHEIRVRRRRGRPKSAEAIVVTSVKLPANVYDALCRRAMLERRSLHAVMKDVLRASASPVPSASN
jgi:hypothetical protein